MITLCELCSEKVYAAVDKKGVTNSSQEKAGSFDTSGRHESAMQRPEMLHMNARRLISNGGRTATYVHLNRLTMPTASPGDHSLLLSGGALNEVRVGGSSRSKIVQLTNSGVSWERSVTPINLIVVSISSLNTVIFGPISSSAYLSLVREKGGKGKSDAEIYTYFG